MINDILLQYASNLLVERPVWRVIFGPEFRSEPPPLHTEDNEIESTEGESEEQPINMQMKLDSNDSSFPYSVDSVERITDDPGVSQILRQFDRIKVYLDKLGVDVNPYDVYYEYHRSRSLQYKTANSVLEFFKNNSLQKFDVLTGVETSRNGEIFRWNNQRSV